MMKIIAIIYYAKLMKISYFRNIAMKRAKKLQF